VIRHTEEYGKFIGLVNYSAAGVTSVPTEYSMQDASHLDQYPVLRAALSPDGSRAAVVLGSPVWNQPLPPIGIVDTDTGAVLTELAEEVLLGAYRIQFSPDGRYLLVGVPGEATKVFDADTGALLRTVANGPGGHLLIATWISLDEFARTSTAKIDVFSVTDETLDRTLPLADGCHGPYFASASTQRMALECGDELVTASTVDGADTRTINAGCAASTCGLDSNTLQFSPSGSHVAFTGSDPSGFDTVFVVADQHGATPTALATASRNRWQKAVAAAWR
jgi:WD40 repeat protein